MRPENEWFKPEKLKAYFYLYEAIAVVLFAAFGAGITALGAFADAPLAVTATFVGVPVVVLAFLTWWIPAFYRTAQYRLTDEEVEYHRGVFFQQKTTVPFNRITNVDAAQGPIQRVVDAGSVGIHTAGYGGQTGAELTVSGIVDYVDVKDQILDKVRRRPGVSIEAGEAASTGDVVAAPGGGAVATGELRSDAMLSELRRIRELLERQPKS
ncbi:PH domain-containing protein [Halorubellus litoreus]|uniref:PH domain-containing protein n=1 Tax=Halorubellus litoreus TaxID=755308 RepID=A0ABD5VBU3_9EURY